MECLPKVVSRHSLIPVSVCGQTLEFCCDGPDPLPEGVESSFCCPFSIRVHGDAHPSPYKAPAVFKERTAPFQERGHPLQGLSSEQTEN